MFLGNRCAFYREFFNAHDLLQWSNIWLRSRESLRQMFQGNRCAFYQESFMHMILGSEPTYDWDHESPWSKQSWEIDVFTKSPFMHMIPGSEATYYCDQESLWGKCSREISVCFTESPLCRMDPWKGINIWLRSWESLRQTFLGNWRFYQESFYAHDLWQWSNIWLRSRASLRQMFQGNRCTFYWESFYAHDLWQWSNIYCDQESLEANVPGKSVYVLLRVLYVDDPWKGINIWLRYESPWGKYFWTWTFSSRRVECRCSMGKSNDCSGLGVNFLVEKVNKWLVRTYIGRLLL